MEKFSLRPQKFVLENFCPRQVFGKEYLPSFGVCVNFNFVKSPSDKSATQIFCPPTKVCERKSQIKIAICELAEESFTICELSLKSLCIWKFWNIQIFWDSAAKVFNLPRKFAWQTPTAVWNISNLFNFDEEVLNSPTKVSWWKNYKFTIR